MPENLTQPIFSFLELNNLVSNTYILLSSEVVEAICLSLTFVIRVFHLTFVEKFTHNLA